MPPMDERNEKSYIFIKTVVYNLDYFKKDHRNVQLDKEAREELNGWIEKVTQIIFRKPYLFTDDEREILHMKISGFSTKEIGNTFNHIKSIYEVIDSAAYSIYEELNR